MDSCPPSCSCPKNCIDSYNYCSNSLRNPYAFVVNPLPVDKHDTVHLHSRRLRRDIRPRPPDLHLYPPWSKRCASTNPSSRLLTGSTRRGSRALERPDAISFGPDRSAGSVHRPLRADQQLVCRPLRPSRNRQAGHCNPSLGSRKGGKATVTGASASETPGNSAVTRPSASESASGLVQPGHRLPNRGRASVNENVPANWG